MRSRASSRSAAGRLVGLLASGSTILAMALLTGVCAGDALDTNPSTANALRSTSGEGCADVVDVVVTDDGATHTFAVSVESADTGWDKYADAWEVRSVDGTVLGVRQLLHPHVDEQPFTRSLSGVVIPDGVDEVTVAARDSVAGFCGRTLTVALTG